jgi:hypothetical protein
MPRHKPNVDPPQQAAPPPPFVLHDNAVLTRQQLQAGLGLARNCISREVRLRRLRVARRGGKYYFLGAWVRQWLADGEVRRGKVETANANACVCEADVEKGGEGRNQVT